MEFVVKILDFETETPSSRSESLTSARYES